MHKTNLVFNIENYLIIESNVAHDFKWHTSMKPF